MKEFDDIVTTDYAIILSVIAIFIFFRYWYYWKTKHSRRKIGQEKKPYRHFRYISIIAIPLLLTGLINYIFILKKGNLFAPYWPVDLQVSEPQSGWAYKKLQEIIEFIFGTIKRQWDMDHTLVKGGKKVETEYRLAAICYILTRVVSIIGIERLRKRLKKLQKSLFSTIFLLGGSREFLNTVNHYIYNFKRISLRPVCLAPGGRG